MLLTIPMCAPLGVLVNRVESENLEVSCAPNGSEETVLARDRFVKDNFGFPDLYHARGDTR